MVGTGERKYRYSQIASGRMGYGKGLGAMGSHWVLSGTWQRGGDMLQFLIMKDDFGSCVESALEREQKQGGLLRENYRSSSR